MAYLMWHIFTGLAVKRVSDHRLGPIPVGIYPAADGYVQIVLAPNWLPRFAEMLGDEEVVEPGEPPRLAGRPGAARPARHRRPPVDARPPQAGVHGRGAGRKLGITALNTTLDVLADEHFRARGFWQPVEHPVAGRYETPGPPFRMADGWRLRRAGAAARPARCGDPGRAGRCRPRPRRPAPRPAARGGRSAGRLRAAAGRCPGARPDRRVGRPLRHDAARRPRGRGDPGRQPEPLPHRHPRRHPPARGPATTTTWATSGAPSPRTTRARARGTGSGRSSSTPARSWAPRSTCAPSSAGRRSCAWSSGPTCWSRTTRPRCSASLGLGWDALHARNPRLIVLRMPSLGLHGPYADYIGFGAHVEALCGLTSLRGLPRLGPRRPTRRPTTWTRPAARPAPSPCSPRCAAGAATGEGELIELSQAENMLQHIGEHLVDVVARRAGRAQPRQPPPAPGAAGLLPVPGRGPVGRPVGGRRRRVAAPGRRCSARPPGRSTSASPRPPAAAPTTTSSTRGSPAGPPGSTKHEVVRALPGRRRDRRAGARRGRPAGRPPAARRAASSARTARPTCPSTSSPATCGAGTARPCAWGPLSRLGGDNEYVYREVLGLDDAEWAALDAEGHLNLDYVDADGKPL